MRTKALLRKQQDDYGCVEGLVFFGFCNGCLCRVNALRMMIVPDPRRTVFVNETRCTKSRRVSWIHSFIEESQAIFPISSL